MKNLKHTRISYDIGCQTEDLAGQFLEKNGFKILERNFRSRSGEIDIIAQDGQTLCFVEVRARAKIEQGHPFETISAVKKRRLTQTILFYLSKRGLDDCPMRFDAIALTENGGGWTIEHIKNACDFS